MATTVYVVDPDPDERTWIESVLAPTVEAVVFFDDADALLAHQPIREDACLLVAAATLACCALNTAQQAQAVARYGAVALTAFREVENSLSNERLLALQLPLDQKALDDRTEAVRIATIQYKAGRRDLLWVAQLQTAQLATESNLIRLRGTQRTNRVRLYQVLGGSFDAAPPTTASAADASRSQ